MRIPEKRAARILEKKEMRSQECIYTHLTTQKYSLKRQKRVCDLASSFQEQLQGLILTTLLQFEVDPSKLDLSPDPMLLLIKAAVNWSWCCGQKLLPACGRSNEEEEEEELVAPSTPIPTTIGCKPVPVR
ncbi:hypothetical protein SEMRO_1546_G281450.1 [Seminavis robusta]|uniref:Uncharacterized protein n=1 Tax=Seminavis robusta TaxID=568900 RepID=A0A9N8HSP6_9STRA|nr:hypothetical protein SEMRO_1546_G281450.1 [Seminavis robusta]|eukprot:Sro1546_g281450.1 n/a (130) ;mRNA; f:22917-23306